MSVFRPVGCTTIGFLLPPRGAVLTADILRPDSSGEDLHVEVQFAMGLGSTCRTRTAPLVVGCGQNGRLIRVNQSSEPVRTK